jgi:CHAT domain-containing protein
VADDLMTGEVDSAIAQLSKAAELDPSNAVVWSDLAATHLQRNASTSEPYELLLAFAAANRAVLLDPTFQEGRFNRAVALERLTLYHPAAEDWRLVSEREGDPSWAREALKHVDELARRQAGLPWERKLAVVTAAARQGKLETVRKIVARSPQRFREHLEEELLTAWARAESELREPEARRDLALARAIGDALAAAGGDRMAADTIAHIDALRASNPDRFRRLTAGFRAYTEGHDLYGKSLYSDAFPRFEEARDVLSREGSPFAHWATFWMAACRYQRPRYREASAHLRALIQDPETAPYKALRARALSFRGVITGIEGDLTASNNSFEAAEEEYRAIHELPNVARVSSLMAENYDILGQPKKAWSRLYAALVEPATFDRTESRSFIYGNAARVAQRGGEVEVALWFQEEIVRNAQTLGRPEAVAGALRQHASLLAALGRKAEAARSLAQARESLEKISDPSSRRGIEADILLVEGEVLSDDSPRQAIERFDEAIEIFLDTSYYYRLGHAFVQRALVEQAEGMLDAAERDLVAAITETERQRKKVDSAEDQISYFDHVEGILDTMIDFQLEHRQRPDEALRFSEQAKARVLLDWMLAGHRREPLSQHLPKAAHPPVDLREIQRDLPAETAMIEYAVLPERIVIWVFHRDGKLQYETVDMDEKTLEDLVQRFRRAVTENRPGDFEPLAEEAYDRLIQPVAQHLASGERLVLIPDGALHNLPFSVLRNRQTGRYLVQERAFTMAPSARVYASSRRRDRELARNSGSVLVVTAPDFDSDVDTTLLPLSAGDTEAEIAKIFPGSQVLREGGATREAFLQAAGGFEMLHFGGHSVVNENFPLLSYMLFAQDPGDPSRGILHSEDVLSLRFPRTRLVVLASCGTALGRISRTEGVQNLARPFLAAGVPAVVASLWSVDDQLTADFFIRFYRNLSQHFDVAEALRATQIESIEKGEGPAANPRAWGAFEAIGSAVAGGNPNALSSDVNPKEKR